MPQKTETNVPALIIGKIIISAKAARFIGATAHIYLEDISRADSYSEVLVETTLTEISHPLANSPEETIIDFTLSVSERFNINPTHDYSVRVWIDIDGDGEKGKGDLHSSQTYPVLTYGRTNTVSIRLD
ncbi:MAG: YbaY family lipoprotein [Pyrinomonadaceae bacterium]|nr:YbaY family lipoprotein [Pyrinomonadaceae bacterium]